jgi:hypothetical protein
MNLDNASVKDNFLTLSGKELDQIVNPFGPSYKVIEIDHDGLWYGYEVSTRKYVEAKLRLLS